MSYILNMVFLTTTGEKVSLNVSDVRKDLTDKEIQDIAAVIINKDVFENKHQESLKSLYSAKVTEKKITEFEFTV